MIEEPNKDFLDKIKSEVVWYDIEYKLPELLQIQTIPYIQKFSEEMESKGQSSSYYKTARSARDPKKDIIIGKYGEYIASHFLYTNGFPKVAPDMTIFKGRSKGWDSDLPFNIRNPELPNCHVKTCDYTTSTLLASRKNTSKYSWTFQYNNNSGHGGRDALFSTPDSTDIITFIYVHDTNCKLSRIIGSAPWNRIQNIFRDPIIPTHKGKKKCIYSDDLYKLSNK